MMIISALINNIFNPFPFFCPQVSTIENHCGLEISLTTVSPSNNFQLDQRSDTILSSSNYRKRVNLVQKKPSHKSSAIITSVDKPLTGEGKKIKKRQLDVADKLSILFFIVNKIKK